MYLCVSDIATAPDRPSIVNSSLFSWLFPPNSYNAKIPHSSIVVFGQEFEFTEDGILKRPVSKISKTNLTLIEEFENSMHREEPELENFIFALRERFNRKSYSLINCNCNHFAIKLLHFFGVDTEFLENLPAYGSQVLNRSMKVAGKFSNILVKNYKKNEKKQLFCLEATKSLNVKIYNQNFILEKF